MNLYFNTIHGSLLSFAAIFLCIGVGFLFLQRVGNKDIGPGYWALSFFLNSLGFIFWSGFIPFRQSVNYIIGEVFHISGFIFLVAGAYRFTNNKNVKWNFFILSIWMILWVFSVLLFRSHNAFAVFMLKALRSVIFILAGSVLIVKRDKEETAGRNIAGISLVAWGIYILVFAFIRINEHWYFGFLVGFHVLAAFGMVAMVMDKLSVNVEKNVKHIEQLEGILPICSYCKKIRDDRQEWHRLEAYIEDRSKAEFSHGICPDCFSKHRPDR